MASLNREAIEQEIGKRFEKIEKTLERTLEKTLETALKSPAAARAQAAAERAQVTITTAKKNLDDVLLGLEHKGYNLKEPQDLIQTVGRRVLERASEIAEDIRSQVAANPYSPAWVKDFKIPKVTFADSTDVAAGTATANTTEVGEQMESLEDSKEERAAGAVVESAKTPKAKTAGAKASRKSESTTSH